MTPNTQRRGADPHHPAYEKKNNAHLLLSPLPFSIIQQEFGHLPLITMPTIHFVSRTYLIKNGLTLDPIDCNKPNQHFLSRKDEDIATASVSLNDVDGRLQPGQCHTLMQMAESTAHPMSEDRAQMTDNLSAKCKPAGEKNMNRKKKGNEPAVAVEQLGVSGHYVHPSREHRARLKWKERLVQLKAFNAKHGHVDVPRSYTKNPSLGTFVCNQRQVYRRMKEGKGQSMKRSKVKQLNELGFKWVLKSCDQPVLVDSDGEGTDGGVKPTSKASKPRSKPNPLSWEDGIEQLKDFQLVNGHLNVPYIYVANQPLGNFVKSIRLNYKHMQNGTTKPRTTTLLNEPRIVELKRMGFKLLVRQREPWEQRFKELRQYADKYGDCDVGNRTPLGIWAQNQRAKFKRMLKKKPSYMPEERINLLNSIGFDWRIPSKLKK